jgi:hypothetical protein
MPLSRGGYQDFLHGRHRLKREVTHFSLSSIYCITVVPQTLTEAQKFIVGYFVRRKPNSLIVLRSMSESTM